MRAGPLSKPEIVSMLNSYFVPVYAVNEDYRAKGAKPKEEKEAYQRIYREALEKKLSAGTVHVYVVSPEGEVIDSAHVSEAAKPEVLTKLLERNIEKLSLKAGAPVAAAKPQASAPDCEEGALRLHLVARSLDGKGAWSEVPGEDWIMLEQEEAAKFVPDAKGQLAKGRDSKAQDSKTQGGDRWEVPRAVAEKLFTHFYPATENNDVSKNKFQTAKLRAELVDARAGRVRLEGDFRMEHSFYHKADGKIAEGNCVGYVDYDPATRRILGFYLVTDRATYNGGNFGVAVRRE
jgi:hypothetical protein